MTHKILITDYAWPSLDIERDILGELPGELIVAETGEEDELVSLAPEADEIMTCWKRTSSKVIDAAPNCRIVARYGSGLDNIDVDHATTLGIPGTTVPICCLDEVAEHALALMLAMTRRVARFDRALRAGEYGGVPFAGIPRVTDMILGILGYGNIGRRMGRKARGLGMHLLVTDPILIALPKAEGMVVNLDALLAGSDVLTIHLPLTSETQGIIGEEAIAKMKPGTYLINTSRGDTVDSDAVLSALDRGHLAGEARDGYPDEPPDLSHPLFQHPHFIGTPHVSFFSESSVRTLQSSTAQQVRDCLQGKVPDNIVNPEHTEYTPRFSTG